MNSLLAHSIEKMGQFADPANFDPKAYFESNRGSVKEWETAFQKYFHRSVPSAIGLLEWSQQALNDAKNFFQT